MPGSRRTAAILSAAVPAAAVAGVVWWDRRDDHSEPWDPEAPRFPDGEHRRVATDDGVELAVTVAGPDDAPTVVLSHCWTGSRAIWGPVAERLVADDHRVVLYDQRGHGESTHTTDPPSMGRYRRTAAQQSCFMLADLPASPRRRSGRRSSTAPPPR